MTESPFVRAAESLTNNGYSVIPIHPKDKYPGEYFEVWGGQMQWRPLSRWNQYIKVRATDLEIDEWMTWPAANIGVALGELSGIVALDLDNDVDGLHRQIENIVPDSPVKKKGAKGYTAFYRFSKNLTGKKTWNKGTVRVAEILTNGQQTVLPPSIHPTGMEYIWVGGSLENYKSSALPEITDAMLAEIENLFPKDAPKPAWNPKQFDKETNLSDVETMLQHISAEDYDGWIKTGMSLKQEYGDAGFGIWDRWSQSSSKYDPHAMAKKWQSFQRTDRTLASIVYEAKQSGYVAPPRPEVAAVEILPGGNLRPIIKREIQHHAEDVPEKILNAPNLVGETMKYILSTALYPQPVLALAAAIAAVGSVMAHRVAVDEFELRSNVFTLGIAPSGAGKEHARKCIRKLFTAANIQQTLCGTPVSGTAVIKAVHRAKGRAFMMIDEMGRFLQAVNSNKAAPHQLNITTCMMDMYNSAQDVYIGQEYADNENQGGRSDISQPSLCIYGTTVPSRLYSALSSQEAIDGFLARWMIFETTRFDTTAEKERLAMTPPESLIEQYIAWEQHPTYNRPDGGNIEQTSIVPKAVSFTPLARDLIYNFTTECRIHAATELKKQSGLDAIWNRASEHAIKLALIGHKMGEPIDVEVTEWAIGLAENRVKFLIRAIVRNVSENIQEAILKRVLRVIEEAGKDGITKASLTSKTQFLKRQERNEVLGTLQETGDIEEYDKESTGRPIKIYKAAASTPAAPEQPKP